MYYANSLPVGCLSIFQNNSAAWYVNGISEGVRKIFNDPAGSGIYIVGSFSGYDSVYNAIYQFASGQSNTVKYTRVQFGTVSAAKVGLYGSNDGVAYSLIAESTGNGAPNISISASGNDAAYTYLRWSFLPGSGYSRSDTSMYVRDIDAFYSGTDFAHSGWLFWQAVGVANVSKFVTQLGTGWLENPTGRFNLPVFHEVTIVRSGTILSGSGSYVWSAANFSGNYPNVYIDNATGFLPPTGYFHFPSGDGTFQVGDYLGIGDYQFYFDPEPYAPYYFSSIDDFVNILNSGYTGAYGDDIPVGCTAVRVGDYVILSGLGLRGAEGNGVELSYDSAFVSSSVIMDGGISYYTLYEGYTGVLTGRLPARTGINSGWYSQNLSAIFSGNDALSGVIYADSFSGTWSVITGDFEGGISFNLIYDAMSDTFIGSGILPTGYNQLDIMFSKYNPYNLPFRVYWEISGSNFFDSNYITN